MTETLPHLHGPLETVPFWRHKEHRTVLINHPEFLMCELLALLSNGNHPADFQEFGCPVFGRCKALPGAQYVDRELVSIINKVLSCLPCHILALSNYTGNLFHCKRQFPFASVPF